jgi:hypothetical protein
MTDKFDLDRDLQEGKREEAEAAVRRKANTLEVEATGECLFCGEPVTPPQRWCDSYCRDDWSKRK